MGAKKVKNNALEKAFPELTDLPFEFKLSFAGKGTILAEEDLLLNRQHYSCSCFCESEEGILFKVPKFTIWALRDSSETWRKLNKEAKLKESKKKAG